MTIKKSKVFASDAHKDHPTGLRTIMELFDVGPAVAITALTVAALVIFVSVFYFIRSAPPTKIVFASGPEGSVFHQNALKYQKILERNGVKVDVLTSEGTMDNLKRLNDPSSHVDVAFAQGGIKTLPTENLVSLGSISYQPLLLFYTGKPIDLLSGLAGKRVSIVQLGAVLEISHCLC